MPRYRLTLEYDGAPFAGWQIQPNAHGATVQGALTEAIRAFAGESVTVYGAGRTDAGVHALGQVAHINLTREWEPVRVREALNFHLRPSPVSILECVVVDDAFDARFSATARHYLYRILSRRARPTLDRDRAWWVAAPLDADAMATAAQVLVGRHDFTTFRAAACQARNPVRTLDRLDVTRNGDEIRIEASARSFLHHQVRSMVGSLKLVGEGKWAAADLEQALAARDRTRCGPVAPAGGLYLVGVDYGEHGGDQSSPATAPGQVMISSAPSDMKPPADLRGSNTMTPPSTPSNALVRPRDGAMIAGVCAGIARWLGWDVTVVRLLYIILSLASVAFPGILVYLILWVLMPREQ